MVYELSQENLQKALAQITISILQSNYCKGITESTLIVDKPLLKQYVLFKETKDGKNIEREFNMKDDFVTPLLANINNRIECQIYWKKLKNKYPNVWNTYVPYQTHPYYRNINWIPPLPTVPMFKEIIYRVTPSFTYNNEGKSVYLLECSLSCSKESSKNESWLKEMYEMVDVFKFKVTLTEIESDGVFTSNVEVGQSLKAWNSEHPVPYTRYEMQSFFRMGN